MRIKTYPLFLQLFDYRTFAQGTRIKTKNRVLNYEKMVGHFHLIRNFISSSNGCGFIENGHRFVNLRKISAMLKKFISVAI